MAASKRDQSMAALSSAMKSKLAAQGLKPGTGAYNKAANVMRREVKGVARGLNRSMSKPDVKSKPVAKKTASTAKKASPAAKKTSEGLSRTRPVPKPGSVAKGAVGAAKIAGGVAAGAAGAAGAAKGAKAAKAAASGYRAGSAAAKSGRSTASLPSRYQIAAGRANTGRGAAGNFGYRMGSKGAQKYHGR